MAVFHKEAAWDSRLPETQCGYYLRGHLCYPRRSLPPCSQPASFSHVLVIAVFAGTTEVLPDPGTLVLRICIEPPFPRCFIRPEREHLCGPRLAPLLACPLVLSPSP